jgi:hypothetical protein
MAITLQSLGIERLGVEDQLALLDQLWESIASAGGPPLTDAQRREAQDHRRHPGAAGDREDPELPGFGPSAAAQGRGERGGAALRCLRRLRRWIPIAAATLRPGWRCALCRQDPANMRANPETGPILRAVNVQRPANSPAPSLQRPDCALNPPRLATFGLLRVRLRGFSGPFLGRPMAFENPIPATSFDLGQLPSVSVADRQAHGVLVRDSPAPPNPRSPAGGTCATGSGHGKPHFQSGWG